MKKYLLMTLVVLAMVGTSACNKGNENSQQTLADDSSSSQSSTSHIESEVKSEIESEVEDSKPDLFEHEEQSLEPVTSDNVIDGTTLPNSTGSEAEESLNDGETSEQVSEQASDDISSQESTAMSSESEQESSSRDIGGLS